MIFDNPRLVIFTKNISQEKGNVLLLKHFIPMAQGGQAMARLDTILEAGPYRKYMHDISLLVNKDLQINLTRDGRFLSKGDYTIYNAAIEENKHLPQYINIGDQDFINMFANPQPKISVDWDNNS